MANNVFVYCEIEGTKVQEVSQELLTKGRKLANELGVELHAVVAGTGIKGQVEEQILPYGVDVLHLFDAKGLSPYTSKPHTAILVATATMPKWKPRRANAKSPSSRGRNSTTWTPLKKNSDCKTIL